MEKIVFFSTKIRRPQICKEQIKVVEIIIRDRCTNNTQINSYFVSGKKILRIFIFRLEVERF